MPRHKQQRHRPRKTIHRRAVIVLGMHRSGTSAICGALQLFGVDFGKHLLPANKWNRTGYWEHGGIVHLHNELLHSLGSSWQDERPLPAGWAKGEAAKKTQASLRSILESDFRTAALIGLKDPRMCRLMPLWFPLLEALAIEPRFVLML